MIKALLTAGVLAGVLASAGPMPSAQAVPLPKAGAVHSDATADIVQVRAGRGGGGGGGFAMRGGGGGGFALRSAGPRIGGFSGGGRSFNHGAIGSGRSFSTAPRAITGNRAVARSFGGGVKHHRPHQNHGYKHRRGRGFAYYGVPAYYGYSSYYAGDQCAWLYRKAIRTNSRHWWHRYNECRDDYGY